MDHEYIMILLPAFLAGLVIISTHVPLGYQVLKRGIIFIDLAIAQIAALGVIVAHISGLHETIAGAEYWLAALFAMSAAVGLSWLEKHTQQLEALIGCLYVLSATGALLLLSYDPHGSELLKRTLNGCVLWLTIEDVVHHGAIYLVLLLLFWRLPKLMEGKWFYLLFSLAITSSVQMVGIYLVFATLIIPALATINLKRGKFRLLIAYVIGLLGYVSGLSLSSMLDLPSGAAIVWCLACVGMTVGVAGMKLKLAS